MKQEIIGISNLDQLAGGALAEKYQDAMSDVLANIYDPNTDPSATRKVTISLSIKPDENRDSAEIKIDCKSTLAPRRPVATRVYIDKDSAGNVVASEITRQLPGQVTIDGEIIDPKIIPLGRASSK